MRIDESMNAPRPPERSKENMTRALLRDFLAGAAASGLGKFLFAGVERVSPFASLVSASHYDYYYWPRNLANIARALPIDGMAFAFNDHYKRAFQVSAIDYNKDPLKFYLTTLAAGGAAGATSLVLVYPFTVNHLVVEEQPKHKLRNTDTLSHRWRTSGILGVYRGFLPSVICATVYRAGYFGFYETAKTLYTPYPAKSNFFTCWFVAWMTTSTAAFLVYPFDIVRRRVIAMQHDRHHRQHATTWNALMEIAKSDGGLFRGAAFNAFRSIGGSMALAFYDMIKSNIKEYETFLFTEVSNDYSPTKK